MKLIFTVVLFLFVSCTEKAKEEFLYGINYNKITIGEYYYRQIGNPYIKQADDTVQLDDTCRGFARWHYKDFSHYDTNTVENFLIYYRKCSPRKKDSVWGS